MDALKTIKLYRRRVVVKKPECHSAIAVMLIFLSFLSFWVIFVNCLAEQSYSLLFVLPIVYGLCCLVFMDIFRYVPSNLGITLILVLFFVRTIISPVLLCIGDYGVTVDLNIGDNTAGAILLVAFETIAVFWTMKFAVNRKERKTRIETKYQVPQIRKSYVIFLLVLIGILFICYRTVPQLLTSYRTIFNLKDQYFVNFEDAQVVDKYGTTFTTKLALVTGQYLVRILTILIPAFAIVALARHNNIFTKIVGALCCLFPLMFIGGAIARSLIYIVVLLLLYNYMFFKGGMNKKTVILLVTAGVLVVIYWIFFSNKGVFDFKALSKKFSAYFSGVNVVSGVFNLPTDYEFRLRYFIYDYTSTFPYGNTIFGINHETVQPFFNKYNESYGQIPPTIAMSYYYFGPLFAPIYSMAFAYISVRCGKKVGMNKFGNPFRVLRHLLIIFAFAMGIVMYNIEITMTNFFSMYLPLLILEKICYKGDQYVYTKGHTLLLVWRKQNS